MKRHIWMWVLIPALAAGPGWAAKQKARPAAKAAKTKAAVLPVSMEAVGTFDEAQPSKKVSIFAAPEEIEPASFAVKSAKAMPGLTVKLAGDPVSGKNKLSASRIAISAVEGNQLLPLGAFDVTPGDGKRFWMTVDVPKRTPAGVYQGALLTVQGQKTVGKLPVELRVLGMRLLRSSKQYGIVLPPTEVVDESFRRLLSGVRACGFGLVSASVPQPLLTDAFAAIKEAGFGTPVPFTYPMASAESAAQVGEQARAAGIDRLLYTVAWQPQTPEEAEAATSRIEAVRKARLKAFAIVDQPAAFDRLAGSVDVIDCHVDLPYIQGLLAGGKRATGRNEWWYWDVTSDAKKNRLYAGLLLWKSGLDGASPPIGQRTDGNASQPPVENLMRSIEWQALREGIDDTRYTTTMMAALREVKDALKVAQTKNAAAAQKTVEDAEAYLSGALARPLMDLNDHDYQEIRLKLAQFAIKLRGLLK